MTAEKDGEAMTTFAADTPKIFGLFTTKGLQEGGKVRGDFSEFYDGIASIWQKQTTAVKLKQAFKDFYGKEIDIPAAMKEMEPVLITLRQSIPTACCWSRAIIRQNQTESFSS